MKQWVKLNRILIDRTNNGREKYGSEEDNSVENEDDYDENYKEDLDEDEDQGWGQSMQRCPE